MDYKELLRLAQSKIDKLEDNHTPRDQWGTYEYDSDTRAKVTKYLPYLVPETLRKSNENCIFNSMSIAVPPNAGGGRVDYCNHTGTTPKPTWGNSGFESTNLSRFKPSPTALKK